MNLVKRSVVSEDLLSLWIGLFVFILSLGVSIGFDAPGWGTKTSVWINISDSISTVSGNFTGLRGSLSSLLTFLFLSIVISAGLEIIINNFNIWSRIFISPVHFLNNYKDDFNQFKYEQLLK